ncbi:fumarylacetoacetate hydrolase family protein [Oligosphaera ethanolica]|uniref:2-keto-4-pentenoate hydratase/2-oxohepta-3-ene-1,7-dioic acid hydratase in catechol pathway n=1 Tax=Oligosphaera ethanolica TaxID=760260 RepID=A0AAE3VI24_9BACT|nr:fumarylacetoacetate hydrolase family protein [Oligosphaera ethanolica]MDQ0290927.1 2-keto-4-pentenoate hydratase/2-oxohepta-3-ene-1,7-dioic acid hydratase in catechol pathway [Oligosphaera ethanolica]NLE53710.1 fumarylacetoacetate hydrolase family protein [Lentisphaerota bacterium]
MRICRFQHEKAIRYGLIHDDTVDILDAAPFQSIQVSGKTLPLSDLKLLAPVSPPNILAIGRNYLAHVNETSSARPERPLLFIKATTALTNPEAPIVLPAQAPDAVDYEAELAVVIGRNAHCVSEKDALDYVLGYTCANDVSARDCQLKLDGQWARGKSFDSFCPLGPWIETDLSPDNLTISTRLNGQVMQQSTTANMMFDCRYLISYLSHAMTLLPGTIILTGTPDGVGMARNPPVYLKHGDVVEVSIEGIGTLRNPVVKQQ